MQYNKILRGAAQIKLHFMDEKPRGCYLGASSWLRRERKGEKLLCTVA